MITPGVVQAFTIGVLRLVAVGAAVYIYINASNNAAAIGFAGLLASYALGGQALDVLKVNKQIQDASTVTTVSLTQPTDTPSPVQLTAKTEPAPTPQTPQQEQTP
jgi:hypothetical protein